MQAFIMMKMWKKGQKFSFLYYYIQLHPIYVKLSVCTATTGKQYTISSGVVYILKQKLCIYCGRKSVRISPDLRKLLNFFESIHSLQIIILSISISLMFDNLFLFPQSELHAIRFEKVAVKLIYQRALSLIAILL